MIGEITIIVVILFSYIVVLLFSVNPVTFPLKVWSRLYALAIGLGDKVSYGALLPNRFADISLLNVFTWITPLC